MKTQHLLNLSSIGGNSRRLWPAPAVQHTHTYIQYTRIILNVHFSWAGLKIENFTKQAKKKSQNDQKKKIYTKKKQDVFYTFNTQTNILR